jgi:hypothetical protein
VKPALVTLIPGRRCRMNWLSNRVMTARCHRCRRCRRKGFDPRFRHAFGRSALDLAIASLGRIRAPNQPVALGQLLPSIEGETGIGGRGGPPADDRLREASDDGVDSSVASHRIWRTANHAFAAMQVESITLALPP